ncbi:mitochondrial fusion protein [Ophiostoma piceae UAMH 11346]|uniref:Mitochondrial fusion protein n=1 Tax=Ophiostoma piceae (strain UAMH 11346) TaxID=1262450 RepID=S3C9G3_OPHP1|nr:mitochondrial fusion protein [Ophiostoma piceae UAMH 11346]
MPNYAERVMASYRDGVNPLRPYYIPPSIGDGPELAPATATTSSARITHSSSSYVSSASPAAPAPPQHGYGATPYSQKARDIFSDLDYKDYISDSSPSVVQSVKDVVDELMWRYTSVLMAQPFEVAKTILQVRSQATTAAVPPAVAATVAAAPVTAPEPEPQHQFRSQSHRHRPRNAWDEPSTGNMYGGYESDPDEPEYFTGSVVSGVSYANRRAASQAQSHFGGVPPPSPPATTSSRMAIGTGGSDLFNASPFVQPAEQQLILQKADSILEVISQLWQKEGAWGVWKGTNASFLYTVLQSLLENWSRSLLSALFNVPDLGLKDDVDRLIDIASPYPWASLCVAASAAVATGLILAPLDLVRTRLIITPTTSRTNRTHTRRAISILRSLPSYVCPPLLVLPTVLHALIHPLLTLSMPLVLRTRFMIDRDANPVTFSVAKFFSSSLALLVKLPLETVLRRGQAHVISTTEYVRAIELGHKTISEPGLPANEQAAPVMETIFPVGAYKGVVGTMTYIATEEGTSAVKSPASSANAGSTSPTNSTPSRSKGTKKSKARIVETVYRRGQGMDGLWRGWKVSWWGLVGLWASTALQGGDDGQF